MVRSARGGGCVLLVTILIMSQMSTMTARLITITTTTITTFARIYLTRIYLRVCTG